MLKMTLLDYNPNVGFTALFSKISLIYLLVGVYRSRNVLVAKSLISRYPSN